MLVKKTLMLLCRSIADRMEDQRRQYRLYGFCSLLTANGCRYNVAKKITFRKKVYAVVPESVGVADQLTNLLIFKRNI